MTLLVPERTVDTSLLADVVEHTPIPLWVIGPTGSVVLVNRAAVTFLGYRSDLDVVGGPSHDLLHRYRPDGSAYPAEECPIVCSRGGAGTTPEWFLTCQGDPRRVSWSTRGIGDDGMTLLSFTATTPGPAGPDDGARLYPTAPVPGRSRETLRTALYALMRERFTDPLFSVADLAGAAHLSMRSLQLLFQEIGRSPASEIRRLRLEHAYGMLERGHSVQTACFSSGYSDPGSFTRAFRLRFGRVPTQVRGSVAVPSSSG